MNEKLIAQEVGGKNGHIRKIHEYNSCTGKKKCVQCTSRINVNKYSYKKRIMVARLAVFVKYVVQKHIERISVATSVRIKNILMEGTIDTDR